MSDNEGTIKIDPRIQDSEKIRNLSRRGFMGSVMAGAAGVAGASTLLAPVQEAEAAPLPDLPRYTARRCGPGRRGILGRRGGPVHAAQ